MKLEILILTSQFILGLGVPVDLKEASVTVGSVIKFQYLLPTNSSEYTSRIYGFAQTLSRDMDGNEIEEDDDDDEGDSKMITEIENHVDDENNTLVDIAFDRRKKRALYSEGGIINEIEQSVTSELPLEEAIRKQEAIDKNNLDDEPQRMNRWDFYKIIERMAERSVGIIISHKQI